MKIAANLSLLFQALPLQAQLLAACRAGFSGVEIQFPYAVPAIRLKELLEMACLPLVLINLPAGDLLQGGAGLAAVPERQPAFAAALQEALTYAAMARPLAVNVLPGRQMPGVSREVALATLAGNLRQAAEAFALLGIRVLCEAINPLDMPGFLVNTPAQLQQVLQQVAHANCQAQLDLYHMARQGLVLPDCIRQLQGQIGHVQFADCPGRGAPGTGQLDFAGALAALRQTGYQGWLGAEYLPGPAGTEASLGWLARWQRGQV